MATMRDIEAQLKKDIKKEKNYSDNKMVKNDNSKAVDKRRYTSTGYELALALAVAAGIAALGLAIHNYIHTEDYTVHGDVNRVTGGTNITITGNPTTQNDPVVNLNDNITLAGTLDVTGQSTFAGNVDASAGLDVTGAALTIANQAITQTTGGQVTFAGNVDAGAGLDVTGAITGSTTVTAIGAITGGSLVADNITIDTNTISATNIGGNLILTGEAGGGGDVVVNSDLTMDTDKSIALQGTGTFTVVSGAVDLGNGTVAIGGDVTVADGTNIVLNSTNGTKIGTAIGQKIGFFNTTPVIQRPTVAVVDSTGNLSVAEADTINGLRTALITLGLMASS